MESSGEFEGVNMAGSRMGIGFQVFCKGFASGLLSGRQLQGANRIKRKTRDTPLTPYTPSPRSRGEGWGEGRPTDAEFLPAQYRFVLACHHSKTGLSESLSLQEKLFSRHRGRSARHAVHHPVPLSTFVQGRRNQRCSAESDAVAET